MSDGAWQFSGDLLAPSYRVAEISAVLWNLATFMGHESAQNEVSFLFYIWHNNFDFISNELLRRYTSSLVGPWTVCS